MFTVGDCQLTSLAQWPLHSPMSIAKWSTQQKPHLQLWFGAHLDWQAFAFEWPISACSQQTGCGMNGGTIKLFMNHKSKHAGLVFYILSMDYRLACWCVIPQSWTCVN